MSMLLVLSSFFMYFCIHLFCKKILSLCFERVTVLESPLVKASAGRAMILSSVGTTVFAIFLIQILPILFKIIRDLAADFKASSIFSASYLNTGSLDSFERLSGLITQVAELLQQVAPLIAIFVGGFNLLSNLSRGIAAIRKS